MTTNQFHEHFVEHAMQLAGDYDRRIDRLERELTKLKKIIENIRVDSEADMEVDGSFNSGLDVSGRVDSTPYVYLNNREAGFVRMDELDIDKVCICDKCNELYYTDKQTHNKCFKK